jgi:uncharacterized protein YkwD
VRLLPFATLLWGCPQPTDSDTDAPPTPSPSTPEVCARLAALDRTEVTWSGDAATCAPGDVLGRERALAFVNHVRGMAELTAITLDPTQAEAAQACAVLMHANGSTTHTPPPSWQCYTQTAADAAELGLLANLPAVGAMSGLLVDPGNEGTLGHRRWLLSSGVSGVGIGSTDAYTCLTLGDDFTTGTGITPWPPAGEVPRALFEAYGHHVDEVGWSLQSDDVDLSSAVVQVWLDGEGPVSADVEVLPGGFGSRYAVRIVSGSWSEADHVRVEVDGLSEPFTWEVQPVDCP